MKKERNSNVEMLRIVSMLLIILYHIIRRYGDYQGNFASLPAHVYLTETILGIWGILGVYLYVAISAWFLSSSKFQMKHIVGIVFQTFCYVAVYSVIECAITYNGMFLIIKYSIIKIHDTYAFANEHWFVAPYVMMCCLSPFLNMLVMKFEKKQLQTLLIVLTGLFGYVQVARSFFSQSGMFLYIYLVIAYMKRYEKMTHKYYMWGGISTITILLFCVVKDNAPQKGLLAIACNYSNRVFANFSDRSLIVAFAAVCFLMGAIQAEEKHNRLVNTVGGLTFGVYLFHETFIDLGESTMSLIDYAHKFLVKSGWMNSESWMYAVQIMILAIGTFVVGIAVEYCRKKLIHEPFMAQISKIDFSGIDKWFNMEE